MATKHARRFSTRLSAEQRDQFFAYLDTLPEDERPLFAFMGRKSGLWHQLGGGTAQVIVFVYKDWLVFSTRGMASLKEKRRVPRLITDVAEVKVLDGPIFSSVQVRFHDGSKTKIANVDHAPAARMEAFGREGLRAFERSRLDEAAVSSFWRTCRLGLPLPKELAF
jgi:hypothetical protein